MAGTGNGEKLWLQWIVRGVIGTWAVWVSATLIAIKVDLAQIRESQRDSVRIEAHLLELTKDVQDLQVWQGAHSAESRELSVQFRQMYTDYYARRQSAP